MAIPVSRSACPPIELWADLDRDVLDCLSGRPEGLSPAEIGHKIGVSEDGVRSIVAMLAENGKIRIRTVVAA
jgi:DNA-binding Lrp family transcriptional regulator